MSYDNHETSINDSSPIELYEFQRGVNAWRYTSAAEDVFHDAHTYQAVPVQRSNIEQGSEMGKKALRIIFARDIAVAQPFIATPPSELTLVKVYRQHRGDSETAVIWTGRVLNAEWRASEVEFNCEPVYISLKRVGLRRLYQRNCPHVVFGATCGITAGQFQVAGSVSEIDGNTVHVPIAASHDSGYFSGGFATWVTESFVEKRMITAHHGDRITFSAVPPGLVAGHHITLHPGCDRTLSTCHHKFGNAANYGGFPFIPLKNPMDGTPIY